MYFTMVFSHTWESKYSYNIWSILCSIHPENSIKAVLDKRIGKRGSDIELKYVESKFVNVFSISM